MKIKKFILLPVLMVAGLLSCGHDKNITDETEPTITNNIHTISAPIAKENSEIDFASDYSLSDNSTFISRYKKEVSSSSTSADFIESNKLSIIVSTDRYHKIMNESLKISGVEVTLNHYYSGSKNYYVWDLKETPKKDVTCELNYDVVENEFKLNLKNFTLPQADPYNNFTNLVFNVTLNGNAVKYNGSEIISAANLYNALDANADNHLLSVKAKNGLVLKGFYQNGKFFCDNLGLRSKTCSVNANYKEYYTLFSFSPLSDEDLTIDFTNFASTDYNTYSVETYVGNESIEMPKIIIDGAQTNVLSYDSLKNADNVELVYSKAYFDSKNIDYSKIEYCRINDDRFFKESGRTVVDLANETVKVILKDNTNNLEEIHPFVNWESGAVDDFNSVPKNSTSLTNYVIKFITK